MTILNVLPAIAKAGSLTSLTCCTGILLSLNTPETKSERKKFYKSCINTFADLKDRKLNKMGGEHGYNA